MPPPSHGARQNAVNLQGARRPAIRIIMAIEDVETSAHPTARRRVGAGGRAANVTATSSPGATATSMTTGTTAYSEAAASPAVVDTPSSSSDIRVIHTARRLPPARTLRMTTRTPSVLTVDSTANERPTANPVAVE